MDRIKQHIKQVQSYLLLCIREIAKRGKHHDTSKLGPYEDFTDVPELDSVEYGSEEYRRNKEKLEESLRHHYTHNRHHPEHFNDGISGMTLVDLLEMVSDWKASIERHDAGSIENTININKTRFDIGPQMERVLLNTMKWLEQEDRA